MISIVEDIKSISDLKKKTKEIFEHLHRTDRPIIITVNGKPDAVLIDAAIFERRLKALNLGLLLAEAESDVKKGHTRSAGEFLEELKRSAKI